MKAIPMKGRWTGKRLGGSIAAGTGRAHTKKENFFEVEDDRQISVWLGRQGGAWVVIRYDGRKLVIRQLSGASIATVHLPA